MLDYPHGHNESLNPLKRKAEMKDQKKVMRHLNRRSHLIQRKNERERGERKGGERERDLKTLYSKL